MGATCCPFIVKIYENFMFASAPDKSGISIYLKWGKEEVPKLVKSNIRK